jgi:hypothetical protein
VIVFRQDVAKMCEYVKFCVSLVGGIGERTGGCDIHFEERGGERE